MGDLLHKLVAHATEIQEWELSPVESALWGEAFADAARALPSKKAKALEAIIGSVMPWIGLVGTLSVIYYPRIQHTRRVLAYRKQLRMYPRVSEHDARSVAGTTTGAERGNGDGHVATSGVAGSVADDLPDNTATEENERTYDDALDFSSRIPTRRADTGQ